MKTRSSKRAATSSNTSASARVFLSAQSPQQSLLEKPRNVFAHLVLPERPVVAALRTPIVERMADALAGKNFGETIRRAAVFPRARAGRDVNVAAGNLFVKPRVAHVRQVVHGIVEIEIVVEHPVHEIPDVRDAGHGEAQLDHV